MVSHSALCFVKARVVFSGLSDRALHLQVVTFRYGQFSHLWIDMMQRLGLDVTVIECPWGEGADEARLDAVLKADTGKKIKAVCVVHNETTTGALSSD